jgi:hypothetical protein
MEERVDERYSDTQLPHTAAIASTEEGDGIEMRTGKSRPSQQDSIAGSATDAMNLEFVCCLLQPPISHQDSDYVAMRRVLLLRKGQFNPSAISHRKVSLLLYSFLFSLINVAW